MVWFCGVPQYVTQTEESRIRNCRRPTSEKLRCVLKHVLVWMQQEVHCYARILMCYCYTRSMACRRKDRFNGRYCCSEKTTLLLFRLLRTVSLANEWHRPPSTVWTICSSRPTVQCTKQPQYPTKSSKDALASR